MHGLDERSHVFIIRLWVEPREVEGLPDEWRAVIEHVPDSQRRYVRSFKQIDEFIAGYLPEDIRPTGADR